MPSQSRKHRGYRSQAVVAQYLAAHGWPYAEPTGAGLAIVLSGMVGTTARLCRRWAESSVPT